MQIRFIYRYQGDSKMTGNIIDYGVRSLLAAAGISNIVLAAVTDGDDGKSILIKIVVLLTGIITLLLSVFFTGFMVHLANHTKDRRILFEEINNRLNEIKAAVCKKPREEAKDE
jgi:hypothetical protein